MMQRGQLKSVLILLPFFFFLLAAEAEERFVQNNPARHTTDADQTEPCRASLSHTHTYTMTDYGKELLRRQLNGECVTETLDWIGALFLLWLRWFRWVHSQTSLLFLLLLLLLSSSKPKKTDTDIHNSVAFRFYVGHSIFLRGWLFLCLSVLDRKRR